MATRSTRSKSAARPKTRARTAAKAKPRTRAAAVNKPAKASAKPKKSVAAKTAAKARRPARKTAAAKTRKSKGPQLILNRPGNIADVKLTVTADAFAPRVSERLSDYDEGVSPRMSWSGAPQGTKSYVVMLEDPDAPKAQPFVHWVAYGIPGHVTGLPEGLAPNAEMGQPVAILQGVNSKGKTGYYGPRPPEGPAHKYHLEVFALDKSLDLQPAADIDDVLAAMKGHVVASGEVVGEYGLPN